MAGLQDATPAEIDAMLNEFEQRLDTLRVRYEQYFIGVDRLPPDQMRKDVVRLMFQIEHTFVRNTAQKFRVRSLVQRFSSYKNYWDRVLRQIEEGTYERSLLKAKRRNERHSGPSLGSQQQAVELDLDEFDDAPDLAALQSQYDDMDRQGQLDRAPRSASPVAALLAAQTSGDHRLSDIQSRLGGLSGSGRPTIPTLPSLPSSQPAHVASAPSSEQASSREEKLAELRRRMAERATPAAGSGRDIVQRSLPTLSATGGERRSPEKLPQPGAGADAERLRKLAALREKVQSERGGAGDLSSAQPGSAGRAAASLSSGVPSAARPAPVTERSATQRPAIERPATMVERGPVNKASVGSDGAGGHAVQEKPAASGARQIQIERRTPARPASPASGSGSGDDARSRQVYEKLLEAKKTLNEPTTGISYESVRKSMEHQREQIKKTRGAADVDFKVVVKDGKAFLKPDPKS